MNTRPSVVDVPVTLRRDDVLHFLGYPPDTQPRAAIAALLDDILVLARPIVKCRGTWIELSVERACDVGLTPIAAQALVVGLVTAGATLESRMRACLLAGSSTEALLCDACGSAAVEEAADALGVLVAGREHDAALEAAEGARVAALQCRLSPGYGRWPITAQRELFRLLPHRDVGVELLPSCLMSPEKSISFAMWLGSTERPAKGLAGCKSCQLARCRYRRTPAAKAAPEET